MRRGLVHALAWLLATGAAVTLSWWGVHTVMAGTAYDPPRAVPLAVGARAEQGTREPVSSSTQRPPPPSPSPSRSSHSSHSSPKATSTPAPRTTRPPASRKPSVPPSAAAGEVKSYRTDGGRVAFELGSGSAKLVSATPAQGWSMRVWTNTTWIRVDFSDETGATYSVFCTWNDHQPQVQVVGP